MNSTMFTSYFDIIYGIHLLSFFFFFEQHPKYITYATTILLMSYKWVVHKQFGKNLKIMTWWVGWADWTIDSVFIFWHKNKIAVFD